MPMIIKRYGRIIFMVLLFGSITLFTGCASGLQTVAPTPPEKFERLGYAKGEATGGLWVFFYPSPALQFIPIGLNDRVERAYGEAISSVPGATGLINVTYQESWYWYVFGTAWKVRISGEAIREVY